MKKKYLEIRKEKSFLLIKIIVKVKKKLMKGLNLRNFLENRGKQVEMENNLKKR